MVEKNRQEPAGIKDIISHLVNDLEIVGLINRMPVVGSLKKLLLRRSPKLRTTFLEMQQLNPMISGVKDSVLPPSLPPVWLVELFGPNKTRFSAEKAKKVLGWSPLVSLEEGQKKTLAWLESVGLL